MNLRAAWEFWVALRMEFVMMVDFFLEVCLFLLFGDFHRFDWTSPFHRFFFKY